jgi:CRISPR-associated protein Cmr3
MSSAYIEALDVLSFRGNRLFGDAGSFGEAQMPPPPSVFAGALRSHLLVRDGVDLAAFAQGKIIHAALGTPRSPGPFTLAAGLPARRLDDGRIEPLYPLPADLVVARDRVSRMRAVPIDTRLAGSGPLPLWPVLAETERAKAEAGRWLSAAGLRRWLAGELPLADQLVKPDALWQHETRVGIALDAATRRADDGKLYSLQTVSCRRDVGFAVQVQGAELAAGVLRLGGDGRGACITPADIDWPEPSDDDLDAITRSGRARLLLTSPGLFPRGWLPAGSGEADAQRGAPFELHGVRARIVCAAVARAQVVSGFDLAQRRPKPAQRAAPAGSVYWLADLDATPEALRKLAERGLWTDSQYNSDMRRAEGFNRVALAQWK